MHSNDVSQRRRWRALWVAVLGLLAMAWPVCHAAGSAGNEPGEHQQGGNRLTEPEMRWLQAVWPVLLFARDAGLPVDVVVQPQPAPELPPLALAWVGGRCKFVLSLRGNPEVEATDARIAPELFDATMQLMAAHELGHCTRHVRGEWMLGPPMAGGVAGGVAGGPAAILLPALATQREEAYADLVGLAWTQRHHAALYGRVYAWLVAERLAARQRGPMHDTLAWAQRAVHGERFGSRSVFAEADELWRQGPTSAD